MNFLFLHKYHRAMIVIVTLLSASGCGDGGGGSGASNGQLTLRISDAPVDAAEHVFIQFSGLELQSPDAKRRTLYYCQDLSNANITVVSDLVCTTPASPKKIDLLALSGGLADFLLNLHTLPAGHYNWIRLKVDTAGTRDSYIVLQGGAESELDIPSGDQNGLKLNRGFTIPTGGVADFTIEFDLRKSVHATGTGEYKLRPTLRSVDNTLAGTVSGTVSPSLVPGGCVPSVYIFEGGGVTPDDIDGISPDPITTVMVKLDGNTGEYRYNAAFLESGNYTIAFTCDSAADDPALDDALGFSGTNVVSVNPKSTTEYNF